jgi:hypothetical protein
VVRILPIILIIVLAGGGLIFWRLKANDAHLATPNTEVVDSNPVEVPKTLPNASLDEKVQNSETAIDTIVAEINNLRKSVASLQSSQNGTLSSRMDAVEASLIELKVRVSNLEAGNSSQTTTQTTNSTTQPPSYIPLSSGEQQTQSQDWVNMSTYQISLNSADYKGYKNAQLEVSIRRNQPGNTVYARLYNSTDGVATSSEVSTTSTDYVWLTSSTFSLTSGTKTYILQLKVGDGTLSFVQSARIKINY